MGPDPCFSIIIAFFHSKKKPIRRLASPFVAPKNKGVIEVVLAHAHERLSEH